MDRADRRRIVVHPVVALGEQGDRADVGSPERVDEVLGVPVGTDVGDGRCREKVDVNLAQRKGCRAVLVVVMQAASTPLSSGSYVPIAIGRTHYRALSLADQPAVFALAPMKTQHALITRWP
jgi:hypothetical protein